MNEVLVFLFATALSLYGSLMAGVVNLNVIFTSLKGSRKDAILMAIGGVIPEMVYSGIAMLSMDFLLENNHYILTLKWASIPVLLLFGLVFYFQKSKTTQEYEPTKKRSLLTGFWLGMANPQLIVFWFVWLGIAFSYFNFEQFTLISPKITFVLGTAVGAFITLRIFIFMAEKYKRQILTWFTFPINKIVGVILVVLAIIQSILLCIR